MGIGCELSAKRPATTRAHTNLDRAGRRLSVAVKQPLPVVSTDAEARGILSAVTRLVRGTRALKVARGKQRPEPGRLLAGCASRVGRFRVPASVGAGATRRDNDRNHQAGGHPRPTDLTRRHGCEMSMVIGTTKLRYYPPTPCHFDPTTMRKAKVHQLYASPIQNSLQRFLPVVLALYNPPPLTHRTRAHHTMPAPLGARRESH